jgi:hypothetical protein
MSCFGSCCLQRPQHCALREFHFEAILRQGPGIAEGSGYRRSQAGLIVQI